MNKYCYKDKFHLDSEMPHLNRLGNKLRIALPFFVAITFILIIFSKEGGGSIQILVNILRLLF